MDVHGIYAQPINYPTVPRGLERLRLTPSPLHSDQMLQRLINGMNDCWDTLQIKRRDQFTPDVLGEVELKTTSANVAEAKQLRL